MILVTGASGFVGRHVVAALGQHFPDTPIRAFDVRHSSTADPEGVETVCGRVEEVQLQPVVRDTETVVHLAAVVRPSADDYSDMRRVNVEGTLKLFSAAAHAGCKHFIHMSSAGVYGPPRRLEPFDEHDEPAPATPYQRTKWEAEQVLRRADRGTVVLNILRPAGIYGPGSLLEVPEYRKISRQRWVVELKGGIIVHPTYIDDVVQGIVAMIRRPAPHGTVLNIGGERSLQFQRFQTLLAETLGVPRRRLVLPPRLASPLCALGSPVLRLRARPNPLLREMCRGDLFSAAVDDRRFRERYPHVPVVKLDQGVRNTIEWATTQGAL